MGRMWPGLILVIGTLVLSAAACSFGRNVDGTQSAQICALVESIPSTPDGRPRSTLEDMLTDGGVDAQSDLFALTVRYRTYSDDFDQVDEFEPALRAAVRRSEAYESRGSSRDPVRESTRGEIDNARQFDTQLRREPCSDA